ncbi:MAG: hypothetical protein AAGH68_13680 [Pseudomonadota bacterium]
MWLSRGKRTIHVHVGPHRTGSTAVQHDLREFRDRIASEIKVTPVDDASLWSYARALNVKRGDAVQEEGARLVKVCKPERGDVILSCEDLAGNLPGRGQARQFYPRLAENLEAIRALFPDDHVRFYFVVRDPDEWLRSAYVQLLKYRRRFKSFEHYLKFLTDPEDMWDAVVARGRAAFGEDFVVLEYAAGASSGEVLLEAIAGQAATGLLPPERTRPNTSPGADVVRLLEEANKPGASDEAVQAAKNSLLRGEVHHPILPYEPGRPAWPPSPERPSWLSPGLEALWTRASSRGQPQDQPDILPPVDCNLVPYRTEVEPASEGLPSVGRERMEDQAAILAFRMRPLPKTCYLLGLVISYLRRNTGHEEHAAHLFQRLWAEEYPVLLGFLPTRWLISTFQTFLDHGINEDQRQIGAAGFFLSNTLKLYEAERALDGLPPDQTYPNLTPATKSGFRGLDRFRVGGTDLMLNTLALLLEMAAREDRAGRVLQEFLLRVKTCHTAFSRMDQTRAEHEIDIPPFSDCWSFFEPPKLKR